MASQSNDTGGSRRGMVPVSKSGKRSRSREGWLTPGRVPSTPKTNSGTRSRRSGKGGGNSRGPRA